MLDLARHISQTKMGRFDPADFDDLYEAALEDLVRAKIEGRKIAPRPAAKREGVVDLMAALRESAGLGKRRSGDKGKDKLKGKGEAAPRRKAG